MFMPISAEFLEDATRQLITAGVKLARAIEDRATTDPDSNLDKASRAFERVARGTRRAILIADRLAHQANARVAARKQIIRTVEDTIQREAEEAALEAEFHDRLDSADLEDDITNRPTQDIITEIIHDLGLGVPLGIHPWKRRTPTDIAYLAARAAAPPGPAIARPRHATQGPSG